MIRWLIPLAASIVGLGCIGVAASAQRAPAYDDAGETRSALRDALAEQRLAQARSERLEGEARETQDAATRTAREVAALAARIQQAEAGIVAADARMQLVAREQQALSVRLGREQKPIVSLTAALQQIARRPIALSLLHPGEIRDVIYLRAVMSNAVPQVQQRTASLRARMDRMRQLQEAAALAASTLRAQEADLATQRTELAAVETRQRLAARAAGSSASREAERALALAEQARDLDDLVGELDRAAALRARLAALPGPILRPGSGRAVSSAREPLPVAATASTGSAPLPYVLPVTGRVITGFGAPVPAGLSRGIVLAPLGNAQVVAPAAGRVVFAGPYRGYGRIVIIEHEGGWTSLVTGLARSDTDVGAEVVGGAPIGVAGPGRPSIALELRRDGQAVNPLDLAR